MSVLALTATPLAVTSTAPAAGAHATAHAAARAADRQISYTAWDAGADLAAGTMRGVRVARGKVRLDDPARTARYRRTTWERGTWTSPWTTPGFAFTELVPSWEARTPAGTFVQVQVRGRTAGGNRSSWDTLGRWASYDDGFRRTSQGSQTDDLGTVATDTWKVPGLTTWQVRWRWCCATTAPSRPASRPRGPATTAPGSSTTSPG
jgi:hypothetical protein